MWHDAADVADIALVSLAHLHGNATMPGGLQVELESPGLSVQTVGALIAPAYGAAAGSLSHHIDQLEN
eukprot:2594996-Prymnesium_polylepis.1